MKAAALILFPVVLLAQGMGGAKKAVPRASPKTTGNAGSPRFHFRDIAASTGITAPNVFGGETKKKYILEMTGNGVAIFDYDNDGRPDVFLVNGTRLEGGAGATHRLYRNKGDGTFEDVTRAVGLADSGWAQGVCAGDYDNDGNTDLLVTYYGVNKLYRNLGGRFEAQSTLPDTTPRWGSGCAFLDYDRDGKLDLFIGNYLAFDLEKARVLSGGSYCTWKGLSVFCGPRGFPGGETLLYHNEGGGRFSNVSAKVAVGGTHYPLSVTAADFDNDGWPDIYVACDSTPSLLYHNNRNGTFTEAAVPAGVAYGEDGQERGGMGVAVGDYDNDGWLDIVRTNFMDETSTLYRNRGNLFFEDATYEGGLGVNTKFVSWGVEFADFDHDGWKDLFIASGHIYPEVTGAKIGEEYAQRPILYWNLRNGAFRDVTAEAALSRPQVARGVAVSDLDGDGALEIVLNNMNAPPVVLTNTGPKGNAVILELEGTKSNRSAIGARVFVTTGGTRQTGEIRSGGSYFSQSDFRLHFGLGAAVRIDEIEVRWPSGIVERVKSEGVNQVIRMREGLGVVKRAAIQRRGSS